MTMTDILSDLSDEAQDMFVQASNMVWAKIAGAVERHEGVTLTFSEAIVLAAAAGVMAETVVEVSSVDS